MKYVQESIEFLSVQGDDYDTVVDSPIENYSLLVNVEIPNETTLTMMIIKKVKNYEFPVVLNNICLLILNSFN